MGIKGSHMKKAYPQLELGMSKELVVDCPLATDNFFSPPSQRIVKLIGGLTKKIWLSMDVEYFSSAPAIDVFGIVFPPCFLTFFFF